MIVLLINYYQALIIMVLVEIFRVYCIQNRVEVSEKSKLINTFVCSPDHVLVDESSYVGKSFV